MTTQQQTTLEGHKEWSIVIVDDLSDNLRLLANILKEQGYRVRPVSSGVQALATIAKSPPDLILLDIMMPAPDGYEVCRSLKADEQTSDIPIIFLSALHDVFDKVKAFQEGGVDYITKPFKAEEVLARVNTHLTLAAQKKALFLKNQQLIRQNEIITEQARQLEILATKDFLTGLTNRRDFLAKTGIEVNRQKRSGRNFAIVLLDVDRFKHVNDTYGHACGDELLIGIARTLEATLRTCDLVARWGGEEFIILLPETSGDNAQIVAEKVRLATERQRFVCGDGIYSVTVTLGVCLFDGSLSLEECIQAADGAMYRGKEQGRNCVVMSA